MRQLKDVLSANADNVLYIFYDFETTQNNTYSTRQKNMYLSLSACKSEEIKDCVIDCDR